VTNLVRHSAECSRQEPPYEAFTYITFEAQLASLTDLGAKDKYWR